MLFRSVTSEGVATPPLSSGCLPGITREILLEEAKAAEVPVMERHLKLEDLYSAQSVFITSTTRELLAVDAIEDREINQDDRARNALQKAFSDFVDRYVASAHASRETTQKSLV